MIYFLALSFKKQIADHHALKSLIRILRDVENGGSKRVTFDAFGYIVLNQ